MARFGNNVLGQAQWSFLQLSPRVAHIYGTKGNITTERTNCPERVTLKSHNGETKVIALQRLPRRIVHIGPIAATHMKGHATAASVLAVSRWSTR